MAAVGAAVITEIHTGASCKRIKWEWTCSAGGQVGGIFPTKVYDGQIIAFATIPSAVDVPTDLYDALLLDDSGFDMLFGGGANRSATLSQIVTTGLGVLSKQKPELNLGAAGVSKKGTVYVWVR